MNYEEKTIQREKVYQGNIIEVEHFKVQLPNGRISGRDIVLHSGASVIIPENKEGGIYLVKQYRKAIERITHELPAGKLDKGESPLECAKRELKEETGITAGKMEHILSVH